MTTRILVYVTWNQKPPITKHLIRRTTVTSDIKKSAWFVWPYARKPKFKLWFLRKYQSRSTIAWLHYFCYFLLGDHETMYNINIGIMKYWNLKWKCKVAMITVVTPDTLWRYRTLCIRIRLLIKMKTKFIFLSKAWLNITCLTIFCFF